jgi:uncharacterized protein (TIGR03067 family)
MPRRLFLLLALTAAIGFAPVPPPKPPKEKPLDAKALEGRWTVIKYESGSAKATKLTTLYKLVVIKGNTWTQYRSAKVDGAAGPSYTFTLDTAKSPARIDMTMDNAKAPGLGARRGVLELKGDQLTVTYGMVSKDVPRPAKPSDKLSGLQYRWVLKREAP